MWGALLLKKVWPYFGGDGRTLMYVAGDCESSVVTVGSHCAGSDQNVTTETTYTADGNVDTLTAVNPATGNQTTRYVYGTTLAESLVARSDLLVGEVYPDAADGADRVSYAYNRQGDRTSMTDQNGTLHAYAFDLFGRVTADDVPALGADVDADVKHIGTTYDIRGMMRAATSRTTAGGLLINQVVLSYNDFGQLAVDSQKPSVIATPQLVQYNYADGSANTIRRTKVTYPNARTLDLGYGAGGGNDDQLGRVQQLTLGGVDVVGYLYFGASSVAKVTYPQHGASSTLASGASYPGFDQFGRVVNLPWTKTTTGDLAQIKYGYDLASNRTFRRDEKARSLSKAFDEFYTYDGMHRLQTASRGTLDTGATPPNTRLTTSTFNQVWSLDPTGNWSRFTQTAPGAGGTIDQLSQTRTQNAANEITAIGATVGPVWYQPAHDRAGNMTAMPKPLEPTEGYTATYDAWNRLVQLNDGETIVAQYRYDGLNRRTTKTIDGTSRHYYYSDQWQVLEEQVGASTAPDRQFVWGIRYIDDLVLRDRDTDDDGDLDERLYALQDANWNVVAAVDDGGAVQERYVYDPYGKCTVLEPDFDVRSTGTSFDWETRFTGQRFDTDTALYLFRYRILHSLLGKWISRDIYRYLDSNNLYAYGKSNPVNALDPSGAATIPKGSAIKDFKKNEWPIKHQKGNLCGVVRVTSEEATGEYKVKHKGVGVYLVFDDSKKVAAACCCTEGKFGWIQHVVSIDQDKDKKWIFDRASRYDNAAEGRNRLRGGFGSASDPAANPQPNEAKRPGKGAWKENPWYGGPGNTEGKGPKGHSDTNPQPQQSLFDQPKPELDEEYIAQLICEKGEGKVYFSFYYYWDEKEEVYYGAALSEGSLKAIRPAS
jgi:RHS repeat-associated protein